jgi:hypothetical protein
MHKLNPTIAQLMEFQNGLSVKRNLENLSEKNCDQLSLF